MGKAEKVEKIFLDCLLEEDEVKEGVPVVEFIPVGGIMNNFGLNTERVGKHREEIIELLSDFHDSFYTDGGGGWSFLNFCVTKDGVQWGEHSNMEQLVVLGIAIGKVQYTLPRDMWKVLPGGMPYISIKRKE